MTMLILHPDCAAGPVMQVWADVEATENGCRARFHASGDITAIKVPAAAPAERMDNLWRTTCFEIFWQGDDGKAYREFNLSPSGRWAAYDFDGFRLNSRDAPAEVRIVSSGEAGTLVVEAEIVSDLPLPANVALSAIIEDTNGTIQFWALAFAPGKPDFHNQLCRTLCLEGISA